MSILLGGSLSAQTLDLRDHPCGGMDVEWEDFPDAFSRRLLRVSAG
jgi:hypothetical protein